MENRIVRVQKVFVAALCLLSLALAAPIALYGCHDKTPPMIQEEIVDLKEDALDGQWDVQLEIWKSGDRTNVYQSHLRFNVTSNSDEDYGFSVYRVKEGGQPERFADSPGFQPMYVDSFGYISIQGSDMVYIWFDGHPEYEFKTYLLKGADGKITGSGNALSHSKEGETLATLQIVQTRRW